MIEDFREILRKLVTSPVFTEIRNKAAQYYHETNCPNLTPKDGLALGATAFIDYIFNTDEGRSWILDNHPLILALKTNDIIFEYWGKDDLMPAEEVDPTKLRIIDRESLKRSSVKLNFTYVYTGDRPIPYMGLIPNKYIEYNEGTTSRCTNLKCENHTESRWCVKWSREAMGYRCEFCGHGALICSEGRPECGGCNFSAKNLIPKEE